MYEKIPICPRGLRCDSLCPMKDAQGKMRKEISAMRYVRWGCAMRCVVKAKKRCSPFKEKNRDQRRCRRRERRGGILIRADGCAKIDLENYFVILIARFAQQALGNALVARFAQQVFGNTHRVVCGLLLRRKNLTYKLTLK